jgi:S-formylglutathione hydrolase FrmB
VRSLASILAAAVCLTAAATAAGQETTVTLPVIGTETPRGAGTTTALPNVAPTPKVLDGLIGDWTGSGPGFAGTIVRSHGELVYTDHLFDAYGADDGKDAERLARSELYTDTIPETYRLEALAQNDPAGQFGLPAPEQLKYEQNYGDLERADTADLREVRVAAGDGVLHLLARTTTMTAQGQTALVVLLDTEAGDTERDVPFGTGLTTMKAEYAAQIAGATGTLVDLRDGSETTFAAQTNPDGWANAIEAAIPLADARGIAVAARKPGQPIANVAFRTAEPVRENFDKHQALALHAGTLDDFFADVDTNASRAGATERWEPGPGYHEAQFLSSEPLSREQGLEGIVQPYGIYFPKSYDPAKATPLQLWLHWRGGTAHSAGAATPGVFRDLGERHDTIVVSPRGRGTSSWYVGRGHLDVEEVWADIHERFRLDERRRYVAGHSMGGFGSFLMTVTHPDWFAAALPASPPSTQGAWTGADFEGCDEMRFDDYSPCYIQANDGDARAQHHRRLLENVRHVPIATYHGTADELVPTTGVVRQHERLTELGYRNRLYLFHTQEHFGPPVWDQWGEGARYMHRFAIPETPARVTHVRDMPFERATERVNSGGMTLDFDFGRQHWLRALEPVDAAAGRPTFDGVTKAVPATDPVLVPEAGGPTGTDNAGPYTMTGLAWEQNPLAKLPARQNAFEATLTGARAATLDTARMGLSAKEVIRGKVTTDHPLVLTLTSERIAKEIRLPAGTREFVVRL